MMSLRTEVKFSGKKLARHGLSATMTPSTPAALETSVATAAQSDPATSTCTLPNFFAAVMELRVAAFRALLLWSAMTSVEPKRLASAGLKVEMVFLVRNILGAIFTTGDTRAFKDHASRSCLAPPPPHVSLLQRMAMARRRLGLASCARFLKRFSVLPQFHYRYLVRIVRSRFGSIYRQFFYFYIGVKSDFFFIL
jgi:hypothetical protein